ncbi:alpha-1-antitrypsin-like protein GS55-MS [Scomber scombrus]|uniref:alpha-1-antitrypsin-like protein GS55-MS n=1 Tax=Scomber scombrus TaxID=13677 RepID=UPI002DDBC2CF|nr:alpha-1-antitrypsin-like protein GS55-MS [Scomber scombrus]
MMRAVLSIWILSAVICVATGKRSKDDIKVKHQAGKDIALDSSADSISLVASANKEFAYHLYRKLAAHADSQGKNIFFSPISVSVALAALSVGARGETHRQIFSGLGFTNPILTQTVVDQVFHMLLKWANNASTKDTSQGTAVFLDNSFKPKLEFLDVLKKSYFADGIEVDFTKTKESANTINKYVEEMTNGKINKLVEDLNPNTVMYLISYIYYKGTWQTPFDPKLTKEDMFTVDEKTKVPVQMMNREEDFDTYYDPAIKTSVLSLPFNSTSSMLLLLPDDMATLEKAISPKHITKWLKSMKSRTYDVYLPKFSIKTTYSLNDALTEMGMTNMFGAQAELSGISEGQKLAVSKVVHQATLDVDEAGATAAAATGLDIVPLSLHHIPVLKFDRPFMVLIIEPSTEHVLFMGKIINPNI